MPGRPSTGELGAPLAALALAAAAPVLRGSSNLAETNGLIWVMIGVGTAGSIVTFAFLVYSIWRFRDPKVKGRRYG